jgi:hypothetical protein
MLFRLAYFGVVAGAAAAADAAAAAAGAALEGMGSPATSMHAAQQRESQGTARAAILAGPAHSILTTAAAGAVLPRARGSCGR